MFNKSSNVLVIILLFCFLVVISGCIFLPNPNEKLLVEFTIPKDPSLNTSTHRTVSLYSVTIPEGTKSIIIESEDTSPTAYATEDDLNKRSILFVNAYSVAVDDENLTKYMVYNVDKIYIPFNSRKELKQSDIRGLIIGAENIQGKVKVYITT